MQNASNDTVGFYGYWTMNVAELLETVCVLDDFFEPVPEPSPP